MNSLEQKIRQKIMAEGPITFEAFMEMALYEPDLGYYASPHIEIGRAGDFYTSQHLHPAFGAMLGKQLEEMWEIMGSPPDFCAVEAGAGAGLLCLDIMDYLKQRAIFRSFSYRIVELNPFLRQKQQKLLQQYRASVAWVSSLNELRNLKACILSNELMDAFPVHLVEMGDALQEVYVDTDGEHFKEIKGPPSTSAIADYFHTFSVHLPRGYRTEVNLRIRDWLHSAADMLSEGFILTIDYGYPARDYYSDERNRGTLLCYHRHQLSEDPYRNVGEQDITAHVNYSSLQKWGEERDLKTVGFCRQGTYLISLGIDQILNELYANSPDYLFEAAKIKRLIFPGTLGESHKVLIQYRGNGNPELKGFAMKNQALTL